jgi:hypothetical protein
MVNRIKLPRVTRSGDRYRTVDYKDIAGSLRPAEVYQPVDKTLASADTVQDLFTLAPKRHAVNVFTNPGFETDDISAAWASGPAASAQSQVTTAPRSGANHLLINPSEAVGSGAYTTITQVPDSNPQWQHHIVASAYVRGASGSGDAILSIRVSDGVALASSATHTLTTGYVRLEVSYMLPVGTTTNSYRIYIATATDHNINIYVDDLQVELNDEGAATPYVDVVTNGVNTGWHGTANASPSQRVPTLAVINFLDLTFVSDTYIAFDNTAVSARTNGSWTPSAAEVLASGSIFVPNGTVWRKESRTDIYDRISFVNANGAETPRVYGAVWGRPIK